MDLATEDYYGLWELEWRFRDLGSGEPRNGARKVLGDLVIRQFVEVFEKTSDGYELLPEAEAMDLIAKDEVWEPGSTVWIAASEEGDRAYFEAGNCG